ncbi:16S rRNA (guanine(966)-N(2))-methyltransferase RsmD [Pseudoflavonifractor phocaeensis]|uniref:16S rRNA (guanine(966)-N(2))-methyltransferase RsmD n=1 Tax=Pseudoflavonifractor phocaeensis TaxID=1870988 RepID=UPI00313D5578
MRVITGTARGRKLKELPGLDTRPTTDKVKESIFNIVQFDVEGRRVLDLFAGTGQLGIEALSRGAERCVFVDASKEAARIIKENASLTGFADRARVTQGDAMSFLTSCREKFGLAFLDPPYASDLLDQALERMAAIDIMTENGIIVCESALEKVLPDLSGPYERGREYRYGKIKLTLYRRQAGL